MLCLGSWLHLNRGYSDGNKFTTETTKHKNNKEEGHLGDAGMLGEVFLGIGMQIQCIPRTLSFRQQW